MRVVDKYIRCIYSSMPPRVLPRGQFAARETHPRPPPQCTEVVRIIQLVAATTFAQAIGAIFGLFFAFIVLLGRPPFLAPGTAPPRAPGVPSTPYQMGPHGGAGPRAQVVGHWGPSGGDFSMVVAETAETPQLDIWRGAKRVQDAAVVSRYPHQPYLFILPPCI